MLAEDGRKMSKSLQNYTDPIDAINMFGADAIRLFLTHSAVVKADDLRYSDNGVREVLKNVLIPLWSGYSFFVTYANIDGYTAKGTVFAGHQPTNPLDAWIVSITQKMIADVTAALDDYDLSTAIDPLVNFIEQLNNWYIRRSRRRFWKSGNDDDKTGAYESLYYALKSFSLVAAPFIPFVTESMWQNLRMDGDAESVHLADFPVYRASLRDEKLEFRMSTVQKAVSMGRSLRNQFNLKNRQPLAATQLVTRNAEERTVLEGMIDTIREELNVKEVIFHEREDELVEYSAKANFRSLGKELGAKMKAAAAKIAALKNQAIADIISGKRVTIDVDGQPVALDAEKIIVERTEKEDLKIVNDGTLTVGLDTKVTDELKKEGYVRDLIRGIQNLRKESGFAVTDRIRLSVSGDADLRDAFGTFSAFVAGETLASEQEWKSSVANPTFVEADDKTWSIAIEKL